ncbi:cytochrome c oxidase assembly protein [Acidimangrovimonas pyrenivorans]|uniref:Cytochrome c oxidase assembly protein n=1 Tax=Acidimangrovimonas pyrenivorans TaxID=2030798 RepID=A0ABV7AGQ5_9RHOB
MIWTVGAMLAAGPASAAPAAPSAASWGFNPLLLALLAGAGWLYMAGVDRLAARKRPVAAWRQTLFYAALVLIYAALQSPLDRMAEHQYWLHAVQQLMLRVAGPMLIALSAPVSALLAGLPGQGRRRLARALPHRGAPKRALRALARPLPASALFILTLYFWALPPVQNAALRHVPLHIALNLSAFATGLLFFLTLFDPRDPPVAAPHGRRQMMLIGASFGQILIGAAMTLKPMVVYPAYDRAFGMAAKADEATGGFLMWTPTCLILLAAIMLVVVQWNGAEARRWARAQRGGLSNSEIMALMPQTAEELWMVAGPKNRRLAFSLSAIPLVLFMLVFAIVETVRILG